MGWGRGRGSYIGRGLSEQVVGGLVVCLACWFIEWLDCLIGLDDGLIGATCGVTVSMSACHQCYCVGSSLT